MTALRRHWWLIILTSLLLLACGPSGLIEVRQPGQPVGQPLTSTLVPTLTLIPTFTPVPTHTPPPTSTPILPTITPMPATNTPLPPADAPIPIPTDTPIPEPAPTGSILTIAQVLRVIDGDTIEVDTGGQTYTVRYIGIDTPVTKHPDRGIEPFGPEAIARNTELVEGQTVTLEKDVSETDKYGRLLRYVWVDGVLVNETLVREGYAHSTTYPPDVMYQEFFNQCEREAIENNRGLWALAAPTAPGYSSKFIADVNISDDTQMQPGHAFEKVWRLQNNGNTAWPQDCTIYHVMEEDFGAFDFPLGRPVRPGETADVAVSMVAPEAPGTYESWWQLKDPQGNSIGKPFYVRIQVVAVTADSDLAQPTPPPLQPTQPVPPTLTPDTDNNCHPSYPDVCIPPPPPDLNCGDISYRDFTVRPPDPHGFDRNEDGIGCENK